MKEEDEDSFESQGKSSPGRAISTLESLVFILPKINFPSASHQNRPGSTSLHRGDPPVVWDLPSPGPPSRSPSPRAFRCRRVEDSGGQTRSARSGRRSWQVRTREKVLDILPVLASLLGVFLLGRTKHLEATARIRWYWYKRAIRYGVSKMTSGTQCSFIFNTQIAKDRRCLDSLRHAF